MKVSGSSVWTFGPQVGESLNSFIVVYGAESSNDMVSRLIEKHVDGRYVMIRCFVAPDKLTIAYTEQCHYKK
jgi:hypothetical protein